jgi:PRTRC genetic system ThiF family protein
VSYTVELSDSMRAPKIVVVGCGGTGGFVADGLCRLLIHSDLDVLLVDYDRVEEHNLMRQSFFEGDVGKFKSRVLAERLARQYGRKIGWTVYPYERDLLNEESGIGRSVRRGIIIGCVDRPASRRAIAQSLDWGDWWLDAGNGYQSGQVLIGNTAEVNALEGAFNETYHTVDKLPIPSLQLPALLAEPSVPAEREMDCAEAVEDNLQSPTINQAMASLVVEFVYKLLTDKLTWMGAYIDLEAGTLQPVPAEPVTVARMFGVKVDTLCCHEEGCHIGGRRNMPGRRRGRA